MDRLKNTCGIKQGKRVPRFHSEIARHNTGIDLASEPECKKRYVLSGREFRLQNRKSFPLRFKKITIHFELVSRNIYIFALKI